MIPGIIASVRTAVAGPTFHAFGADVNGQIKALVTGSGAVTFARSSTATVTDWEGLVKTVLANELRIENARRVENLAASTASPSTQNITVVSGNEYQVRIGATSAGSSTAVCSDAFTGTLTGDAADPQAFDTAKTATSTTLTVTITGSVTDLQVEDVTGQTDQNPSEYVSVGVESGQYHGAMVDGIAYFDYENGNTVVSNKVIEAVGSDLTTALGALFEPAATNYCTHSEEHDNAAWTKSNITIAADSIAAPDGATTADTLTASAGNGTCLDSITLASSDVTYSVWLKRLTGTGNIDLTVDGGTGWTTKTITSSWARYDIQQAAVTNPQVGIRIVTSADAIYAWGEQLEVKDVPTSYVPTSGATATRTADDGDAMFDTANWYGTEGTWYLDIWFGDFIAANYAIFGPLNGSSTVFYSYLNSIKSFNGLANSRVDLAIGQVTDNRFRLVADFELGDTLELGERDVDGSGSFAWDATPASYDQIFVDHSVLNVFRLLVTPMRIRDLYGHTTRQGKTWVEANL